MPPLSTATVAAFDHGRRRQSIAQTILSDIYNGRMRAGQRLITQDLADRFGVSHTPIREALIELAAIGVIDLLPNRGAVVRAVTSQEVGEVCQVRRVLECEAIQAACGRIPVAVLKTFRSEIVRLKASTQPAKKIVQQARDLDSLLHDEIARSSGNGFLAKEIARLKTVFRAFRDVAWEQEEARNDLGRVPLEADEHLAVIDALLEGNAARAADAMATHIRSGQHYWSRVIEQLNPRAAANSPSDSTTLTQGRFG